MNELPDPVTRTDAMLHAVIARQDAQITELKRLNGQLLGLRKDLKSMREPAQSPGDLKVIKEG
jgi:hypothetical protein